ncbi:hypothetical protein F511_35419 [Dorcoceras hygrometricum]|uniref:Uncharacterized protein n=1 Tax=Dorcoceras hygrometricum TaxID=472368 RepID=A0A2Z7BQK7_9LAMI|nr:hypothetical protein F511_35419 [Dorcoceras hygrometricum]
MAAAAANKSRATQGRTRAHGRAHHRATNLHAQQHASSESGASSSTIAQQQAGHHRAAQRVWRPIISAIVRGRERDHRAEQRSKSPAETRDRRAYNRAAIWQYCIDQIRTLALIPLLGNRGGSGSHLPARQRKNKNCRETINTIQLNQQAMTFIGCLDDYLAGNSCLAPTNFSRKPALHGRWRKTTSFRSTTGYETPSSACTRRPEEIGADGFSSSSWPEQIPTTQGGDGGGTRRRRRLV